ncbi:MAG: AAA family ATPase [Lachnospiraceae bacterium]|nr:AAA family ATPase [Lachnospiraceae bacterium]
MGLFDKKENDDKLHIKRIEKVINSINDDYTYNLTQSIDRAFVTYCKEICKDPVSTKIQPIELCAELIETIVANKADIAATSYLAVLRRAEEIYARIFPYGENTPNFELNAMVFVSLFKQDGLIGKGLFNVTLYATFKDKDNYIEFMDSIKRDAKCNECLHDIIQYGLSVRAFFIDDETYTANMKDVAQKILRSGDVKAVIASETKRVEHMAGIYDIDEADVAKTEQQLAKANAMLSETVGILEQADAKTMQLSRVMKDTTDAITEISKRETNLISMKAATAKEDMNAAYNSFLEEQKQEVIIQKDVLLGQIFSEAESKLNELRTMARAITTAANSELLRINTEASSAMDKINNMVANDKDIEKILSKADENKELYDRLAKLELLNNQNIDAITKGIEAQAAAMNLDGANGEAQAATTPNKGATVVADPMQTVQMMGTPQFSSAGLPPMEVDPQAIPEVNPLLDTSIPFETRYKMVMEEKQRRIAKGEHFHKMFDDVVTVLMEDANPYMIGPSGCGKTFMVKQIASILNLDFIDIGYINEEYDILGFQTATGAYSTPNFYRCYKYGKIAFCDELDNGNSRATVKLNSFLSNGKDASYSFPHGENVKRHQNFRIIAAGNTAGNGADANYNTREKIEESVQQRFTPVYVGYDNYVEEKILGEYKDWYQFCVIFRLATDAWSNQNDCAAPGILTTRDTARIRRYLDNKSLDMGKILDYEFIQTKDMEYLAFLVQHMGGSVASYPGAGEIYKMFAAKVNDLRQKGGVR